MSNVCAGSDQRSVAAGALGIVTLWVRAESESAALERGKRVLANRHYGSIGALRAYVEELDDDPLAYAIEGGRAADRRADSIAAGYDAIRAKALAQADGLHEVWLGVDCATVVGR